MKFSKLPFGILSLAVLFAACQNVEFKKTAAGIPYKIFSSKKGDSVKMGSIVKYEVIQKVKDSVYYSSYKMGQPVYTQLQPTTEKLDYFNTKANAEQLLTKTKTGDSIYLVQSTDSLVKKFPERYKPGQQLITTLKVVAVYKNEEEANAAYIQDQAAGYAKNKSEGLESFKKDTAAQASIQRDDKIIEDYLTAHNIKAEKNDWGIYIERLTPGQGPKPKFGQFSNVNYKGMHLTGGVFDQGNMPVQIGMSQVVFGFMEGVSQLSKGEKARVYIPSILAYGPQGSAPKIQPNEVLVFELEVLDITDKQPAQQTMPQQQPGQQPNGQ
jgi:FKBP-type peptidyl-prolyl cis-trans isomerase